MFRKYYLIVLFSLLLITLYPGTIDLYQITGEESLPAQLRGTIHWLHSAIRPQPNLAPTEVETQTMLPPFGVNTFLENEASPEVRAESLKRLHDAGIHFIRQQISWEDIEIHGKGNFTDRRNIDTIGEIDAWAKYDNIVELAQKYDIEILARLDNPPAWSRTQGDEIGTHAPPDHIEDYLDFVSVFVSRYAGKITYIQIWNEPNIFPEWGTQMPDPVTFTDLLCRSYQTVKDANPEAMVVGPALAATIAFNERDVNDLYFLHRMYLAGASHCFDIFAVQGYGLFSGATDYRLRPTFMNYNRHLFIRDLMVYHGDAHKPIWISEMNWNVAPEPLPDTYGRVTEEQQARYLVEAFQRAEAEWPWLEVLNVWFFKRPTDSEQNQSWYYFRLMEPDFTPLPAFTALADYAQNYDPQQIQPKSTWWYTWQQVRPTLALLWGSLCFLGLLSFLAPNTSTE